MNELVCDHYGIKPMLEVLVDSGALDTPIDGDSVSFSLLYISLNSINSIMHDKMEMRAFMYLHSVEFFEYDCLFDKYNYIATVAL